MQAAIPRPRIRVLPHPPPRWAATLSPSQPFSRRSNSSSSKPQPRGPPLQARVFLRSRLQLRTDPPGPPSTEDRLPHLPNLSSSSTLSAKLSSRKTAGAAPTSSRTALGTSTAWTARTTFLRGATRPSRETTEPSCGSRPCPASLQWPSLSLPALGTLLRTRRITSSGVKMTTTLAVPELLAAEVSELLLLLQALERSEPETTCGMLNSPALRLTMVSWHTNRK